MKRNGGIKASCHVAIGARGKSGFHRTFLYHTECEYNQNLSDFIERLPNASLGSCRYV